MPSKCMLKICNENTGAQRRALCTYARLDNFCCPYLFSVTLDNFACANILMFACEDVRVVHLLEKINIPT